MLNLCAETQEAPQHTKHPTSLMHALRWKIRLPCRRKIEAQLQKVDLALVALTVTHFPGSRTLEADEEEETEADSQDLDIASTIGYDPAFLLRFCKEVCSTLFVLIRDYLQGFEVIMVVERVEGLCLTTPTLLRG